MNLGSLAVLSGLFGLYCIIREVRLIIRAKQIRISNLFLIMYGVTYGIVLSLLLIFYDKGIYKTGPGSLQFDYSPMGLTYSTYWFFAAVVGYISFRVAGVLRLNMRFRIKKQQSYDLRHEAEQSLLFGRLQSTSVICLLIGVASFVIWAEGWGGYRNLFLNAAEIRNGSYGIRNPVAFFAKPAQIVSTVSIISLYLIKQKKNIAINVLLFIISFVVSMMYYFAKDGRMMLAMYLLIVVFMLDGTFEKRAGGMGKRLILLVGLFVLFVVIVLNMDQLTYSLRNDAEMAVEDKTALESIMDELVFIYAAGQTSVEQWITEGSPLLIGHDVGLALFAWVPSAFTPKGLIDIWNYNTEMIAGKNALAQFPSDLISTSFYDLGALGPILLPGFWGAVISKLERIGKDKKTPLFAVVYYSLAMNLVRSVNYSMMSSMVASIFHLFVTVLVFWFVGHIKWR